MSRSLVLLISLFLSVPISAQSLVPQDRSAALLASANKLTGVDADGCLKNYSKDEIVVCGKFDANRKYRLPFPILVEKAGKRERDPLPSGNAEIVQQGRCYVTMNERNCFKGLPLVALKFGGSGGGLGAAAGRLWKVIEPPVPNEDYVKQVQVRANGEN